MSKCGECTACCKLLELHEIPSKIDELCRHCEENVGCKIYDTRPKECREFLCMWAQMENAGKELRPDKSNIIFSRKSEDVIAGRLAKGTKMNSLVMSQIDNFNMEGFSVVVFRGAFNKFFLTDKHNKEYVMGAVRGRT